MRTVTFAHVQSALKQWRGKSGQTGFALFHGLCADLASDLLTSTWVERLDEATVLSLAAPLHPEALAPLVNLSWYDEAAVEARWLSRRADQVDSPNPFLHTPYDLLWLDIRSPAGHGLTLPESSLRRLRDECIRLGAPEDPEYADHLRRSLVVFATIHGPGYLVPELVVVGPSAQEVGADPLVSVLAFPFDRDLRAGASMEGVVSRLSVLGPLASGSADWRGAFGGSGRDVRSRLRDRTREVLQRFMALLEETAGRQAPDDELPVLAEAATLLLFRVMFLWEVERRDRLYLCRPAVASLGERTASRAAGPHSTGDVVHRFVELVKDVRGDRTEREVALRGASIFATPPGPAFDPRLSNWLSPLENDADTLPEALATAWDLALSSADSVTSGQISDQRESSAAGAVGFGGAEHAQRVLGDVYEQILAMVPARVDGRPVLRISGKAGGENAERKALGAHYTPEALVGSVVRPALGAAFRHHWSASGQDAAEYARRLARLRVVDPALGSAHFLTVAALELARERAWVELFGQPRDFSVHEPVGHESPEAGLPAASIEAFRARVQALVPEVVRSSCFGVDIKPLAVELGKLSLWLFTSTVQARDDSQPELTFLDANIHVGDSLVGLTWSDADAIISQRFGQRSPPDLFASGERLEDVRDRIVELHAVLHAPTDEIRGWLQARSWEATGDGHTLRHRLLELARELYAPVRWFTDLAVMAELHGAAVGGGKRGEAGLASLLAAVRQAARGVRALEKEPLMGDWKQLVDATIGGGSAWVTAMRSAIVAAARRVRTFHWEAEFPDVFSGREGRGFDVIVSNPPFKGDRDLRAALGQAMVEYLRERYTGQGETPDLAGFFVLRYDALVNASGCIGTLAPNSIAQGRNRQLTLARLVTEGRFRIFRALQNQEWPGDAGVHVAMIHMARPSSSAMEPARLIVAEWNEETGEHAGWRVLEIGAGISSYLDQYPDLELTDLPSMSEGLAFQGFILRGPFDRPLEFINDVPITERCALGAYLNAEDIQQQSKPLASRLVVDFSDVLATNGLLESSAVQQEAWLSQHFPYLWQSLDDVREARSALSTDGDNKNAGALWWLFWRPRVDLRERWKTQSHVVVSGRHIKVWAPVRVPRWDSVLGLPLCPTDALNVIPIESLALLAVISSAPFEVHLRRACSTIKADLRVNPTQVFPPFPLPWPSTWSTTEGAPFPLPVPPTVENALGQPMQALLDWREALLTTPEAHGLTGAARPGGPTDLYNLFDRPSEDRPAIEELRRRHRALLDAVLATYGWTDLAVDWAFERPWIDGSIRYVPVLAARGAFLERLARLNGERYGAELRLYRQHIIPLLSPNGTAFPELARLAKESAIRISDEDLAALIEHAQADGDIEPAPRNRWRRAARAVQGAKKKPNA